MESYMKVVGGIESRCAHAVGSTLMYSSSRPKLTIGLFICLCTSLIVGFLLTVQGE